jgi:Core-2/I-Branching enzyme
MTVAQRVRMRLRDAAGRRRSIMNIAYLILAHNNPGHLARLTQALATENSAIFIHIDKKADIRPFLELAGENVHFTSKRVPVYWGDYSQIEAILTLIDTAMAGSQRYDYLVLLSGSDYPLRTAAQLEAHFVKYRGSEFINMVAMPSEAASKPLSRLTDYKPRHGLTAILAAQGRRVLVKAGIISRTRDYKTCFGALTPYAGSEWWALTHDACAYIQNFVARNRRIMKFFVNTSCPDEMVFQTILGNSPFKDKVRRNLTYTDWGRGGHSPSNIEMRHIELIRSEKVMMANDIYGQGELIFVRKVADPEIVDQLQQFVQAQQEIQRLAIEQ